jgi:hypothetical protein
VIKTVEILLKSPGMSMMDTVRALATIGAKELRPRYTEPGTTYDSTHSNSCFVNAVNTQQFNYSIFIHSCTPKMQIAHSSETSVTIYQTFLFNITFRPALKHTQLPISAYLKLFWGG